MRITKAGFLSYANVVITLAALLSVIKFGLEQDPGALRVMSIVASPLFALFALYLTYADL